MAHIITDEHLNDIVKVRLEKKYNDAALVNSCFTQFKNLQFTEKVYQAFLLIREQEEKVMYEKQKKDDFLLFANQTLASLGDVTPLNIQFDQVALREQLIQLFSTHGKNYIKGQDDGRYMVEFFRLVEDEARMQFFGSVRSASVYFDRYIHDLEYNIPAKEHLERYPAFQPVLDTFDNFGRTVALNFRNGSSFNAHYDYISPNCNLLRFVMFINNCNWNEYEWIFDEDHQIRVEDCKMYLLNVKRNHRIKSYADNCLRIIVNCELNEHNFNAVLNSIDYQENHTKVL